MFITLGRVCNEQITSTTIHTQVKVGFAVVLISFAQNSLTDSD